MAPDTMANTIGSNFAKYVFSTPNRPYAVSGWFNTCSTSKVKIWSTLAESIAAITGLSDESPFVQNGALLLIRGQRINEEKFFYFP
jgi:hypothetical protein